VGYTVQERAEWLGTFRWIEIQLMEMLARWVPTTPEMEIKVLFGRHVWDCAQHADALGRRAFELRAPLHYTLPAIPPYGELLQDAADLGQSGDRVNVFYDVLHAGLATRYREYLAETDALMDEPTVRIVEAALRDRERMCDERRRYVSQAAALPSNPIVDEWRERERALAAIVAHGGVRRAQGLRT
jgi:hypothetical protein